MRLLSSVGTDMASLMLKSVEGLVTERALVGTRKIRSLVVLGALSVLK